LEYTIGEADENNQIPVDLFISVNDSFNFIMLPNPKYDSNEGFSLKLSAKDYNFLGTLTPADFDIGFESDETEKIGGFFNSSIALPFELGGLIWNLDFGNELRLMQGDPIYYYNHLGLSLDLPIERTTLTFGVYESIYVNEENDDRNKALEGDYFRDIWYLNTKALARWNIPTGLDVFGLGELNYTPELDFGINYRPGGEIGNSRRGFEITLKQSLGFGVVNWVENFRDGLTASIQSTNMHNFFFRSWNNQLSITGIYHKIFTDFTGFSGRIRWAHWFQNYYSNAGDVIRGVPDNNLAADFMISINLQESFRVFQFLPSKWFNIPWMRIFDFEQHVTPFVDLALVQDPLHNRSFSFDDMVDAAGIELTTYPFYFQSVFLRISFGVDMRELLETGADALSDSNYREIFIGLGHYF
jgi:hypothetical protein